MIITRQNIKSGEVLKRVDLKQLRGVLAHSKFSSIFTTLMQLKLAAKFVKRGSSARTKVLLRYAAARSRRHGKVTDSLFLRNLFTLFVPLTTEKRRFGRRFADVPYAVGWQTGLHNAMQRIKKGVLLTAGRSLSQKLMAELSNFSVRRTTAVKKLTKDLILLSIRNRARVRFKRRNYFKWLRIAHRKYYKLRLYKWRRFARKPKWFLRKARMQRLFGTSLKQAEIMMVRRRGFQIIARGRYRFATKKLFAVVKLLQRLRHIFFYRGSNLTPVERKKLLLLINKLALPLFQRPFSTRKSRYLRSCRSQFRRGRVVSAKTTRQRTKKESALKKKKVEKESRRQRKRRFMAKVRASRKKIKTKVFERQLKGVQHWVKTLGWVLRRLTPVKCELKRLHYFYYPSVRFLFKSLAMRKGLAKTPSSKIYNLKRLDKRVKLTDLSLWLQFIQHHKQKNVGGVPVIALRGVSWTKQRLLMRRLRRRVSRAAVRMSTRTMRKGVFNALRFGRQMARRDLYKHLVSRRRYGQIWPCRKYQGRYYPEKRQMVAATTLRRAWIYKGGRFRDRIRVNLGIFSHFRQYEQMRSRFLRRLPRRGRKL